MYNMRMSSQHKVRLIESTIAAYRSLLCEMCVSLKPSSNFGNDQFPDRAPDYGLCMYCNGHWLQVGMGDIIDHAIYRLASRDDQIVSPMSSDRSYRDHIVAMLITILRNVSAVVSPCIALSRTT